MCGFVVIVTGDGPSIPFSTLRSMTDSLAHRGPDSHGYAWISPEKDIALSQRAFERDPLPGMLIGHQRLSILDLSDAASQPFRSRSEPLVLAYNGEVFNYLELRKELAASGREFQSTGDTEVVLSAYEHWGLDAFRRFNGMWAIAIYDGRTDTLVVSRDRFGVKPLYRAEVNGARLFASELKALARHPGLDRSVGDGQILEYLRTGRTNHSEATFFGSIRSIPPATTMVFARDGSLVASEKFWSLPAAGRDPDAPPPVERYRDLLRDAVRIRTRSDVPIATMLSGGLDSTAVTALIVEQSRTEGLARPERRGVESFHNTFTACWPDAPHIDEEQYVDLMCRKLGLNSEKLYPSATEVGELLERVTYVLDEPFENPVAMIQYMLMDRARERGVKVVLNGHGSDEVLAGYPDFFVSPFLAGLLLRGRIRRFLRERRLLEDWYSPARVLAEMVWSFVPRFVRRPLGRRLTRARAGSDLFATGDYEPWSRPDAEATAAGSLPPLKAALWRSFGSSPLPQWLRMEDRVSMAHGIESRLPFMDYRLVEFGFELADTMKIRDGFTKYVLRQAMGNVLPQRIVENRSKQRFSAPYRDWFRGPWERLLRDLFLCGDFRARPYLDSDRFRRELEEYLEGGQPEHLDHRVVWRILQTEIWLRVF